MLCMESTHILVQHLKCVYVHIYKIYLFVGLDWASSWSVFPLEITFVFFQSLPIILCSPPYFYNNYFTTTKLVFFDVVCTTSGI